ncbi:olfactory receptor 11A1-like [Salarias fasciatus]|uniref:olfactory receptor 11A1-like n=1 Tax=Salarias fasciatus TaxID=181472 RepID=UPI0011768789|nr:olfactory receptor 11A1-like [Salarias fasciatus]
MESETNITYITIGGYVDLPKYRYVYFVGIFIVYISILLCNFTVVYLICKHKNLHEPMYIFIAALLVNTVVYSTNIYPKLLSDILSSNLVVPYSGCLLQFFIFYTLACSEFLLLTVMSYDRYVSICEPLQYQTVMKTSRVCLFLGFAWTVPALLMMVPVVLSADMKLCQFTLNSVICNNAMYSLHCQGSTARSVFGATALVLTVLFPVLFIVFTYSRILVISYRSCKEVRRKAAQTCLPHLLVLISFSILCSYDVITARLGSQLSKTVRLLMTMQAFLYHPLFNPLIYGLKMSEISKHLKRLLCRAKVN